MNVTCGDRERIFADGSATEWMALEAHGEACPECAAELRAWRELSAAATELRDYQDDPALWQRIQSSLVQELAKGQKRKPWWESPFEWAFAFPALRMALSGALVLALAITGGYLLRKRSNPPQVANGSFLEDHALADVERTEREYMKAIDKLASEARPQMAASTSPLVANYQEKLVVLDSAIDELRLQTGQNPSNAHLRYQLLAMYRDKEATLREILEMKR